MGDVYKLITDVSVYSPKGGQFLWSITLQHFKSFVYFLEHNTCILSSTRQYQNLVQIHAATNFTNTGTNDILVCTTLVLSMVKYSIV